MTTNLKSIYKKYREIINYLIAGVLTTVVSLGVYYGCVLTVLSPQNPIELQLANMISWIAAVTFAYLTNRAFVFERTRTNVWKEMFLFYFSRVSTLLMDMLIMFVSVSLLGINDKIAKLLVQIIVTVANYLLSKLIVFKKNP